ncbi:Hypothetical predicted protein [Pelobates cultripes]|uniref:Uncharacterized protein n=1 Tax=Pelobates cultripes TaxID=61616 RepID=A0AAD1TK15_PELCU|nr:Hypothetical predicted protein [Pelobates cultripes]CAH2328718.1 Hypothetical predicted protein [Pelobates cultripes]
MATASPCNTWGLGFMQQSAHSYIEQGKQCLDEIFNAFWAKLQARTQQLKQQPIPELRNRAVLKQGNSPVGKEAPTHTSATNRHHRLRTSRGTTGRRRPNRLKISSRSNHPPPSSHGHPGRGAGSAPRQSRNPGPQTLAYTHTWRWKGNLPQRKQTKEYADPPDCAQTFQHLSTDLLHLHRLGIG